MSESRGTRNQSPPTANKTWCYDAESSLTCLAVNQKQPLVAIAGRNLLQILKICEEGFVSLHRLKHPYQHLANTVASSSSASSKQNPAYPARSYSITDVAWSDCNDKLATSSTGGDLRIWDISRGMTQTACFCGHSRTVHRIHFSPNVPNEVITASQDGTIKLFDIRDQAQVCTKTFHQRTASASPVRDAVFCPKKSVLLAAAQENGIVNLWDTRREDRPYRSFQGHSCSILSIDWHPAWDEVNRNWFATAGCRDHLIKVWDFNMPSHSSAPFSTSHNTPAVIYFTRTNNVGQVRWRIGSTTQLISSCSLTIDLSIHLWELERPFIPFVSFEGHTDLVTSLSWSTDPDFFFSTARDGILMRHAYTDGIQSVRQANPVALAVNCHGHISYAVGLDQLNGLLKSACSASSVSRLLSARHPSDQQRIQSRARKLTTIPPLAAINGSASAADSLELAKKASMISSKVFIAGGGSRLFTANVVPDLSLPIESPNTVASLLLPDVLIYLAQNYHFTGSSIDEICDYNSSVALACFQYFLSQFWLTLKMIYGRLAQDSVNNPPLQMTSQPPQPAQRPTNASTTGGAGSVRRKKLTGQSSSTAMLTSHSGLCVLNFVSPEDHCAGNSSEVPTKRPIELPEESAVGNKEQTEKSPDSLIPSTGDVAGTQVAGSLGESVNFLFSDRPPESQPNSLAGNGVTLESQQHLKKVGIELSEAAGRKFSAESFQKLSQVCPDEAFELRPRIDPEVISRSSEQNSAGVTADGNKKSRSYAGGLRNRLPKPNQTQGAYRPSELSSAPPTHDGGLDLTSSLNCLDLSSPIGSAQGDPYLKAELRPNNTHLTQAVDRFVDFSHLVGPWFIELVDAGHVQSVCTALLVFGTERTRINDWASEAQIENWFYAYLDLLARFRLWSVSTRIIKQCGGILGGVDTWLSGRHSPGLDGRRRSIGGGGGTGVSGNSLSKETFQTRVLTKTFFESAASYTSPPQPLASHVAILNQAGTSFNIRCGICTKPMQRTLLQSVPPATGATAATATQSRSSLHQQQQQQQNPLSGVLPVWACSRHPSSEAALSTCAICHLTVRGLYLWCVGCSHGGHLSHMQEWLSSRRECPAGCGHLCEYNRTDALFSISLTA
ncbi:WD repeat-containing protein 24 [Sparganum proliferum]